MADADCSNPPASQDRQTISGLQDGVLLSLCSPIVNPDGSFSTTPQTTIQQVSCGDDHGAVVAVSCSGDGVVGHDAVQATVVISISDHCATNASLEPNNSQLITMTLNPGDDQFQSLKSCDSFSPTCMGCDFNSFSTELEVFANASTF